MLFNMEENMGSKQCCSVRVAKFCSWWKENTGWGGLTRITAAERTLLSHREQKETCRLLQIGRVWASQRNHYSTGYAKLKEGDRCLCKVGALVSLGARPVFISVIS